MPPEAPAEIEGYRHGRVPRAIRERQILSLAEDLFAERGYDGTSMDELAGRAGVSKPVIYGLIESKEELYRRVFERAADELEESVRAAIAGGGELDARIEAGTLAFFRFIEAHRGAWSRLLLETEGPGAAHVEGIRARQAGLLVAVLASAAAEPDPRRVEAVARAVNGALEAMAAWWQERPDVPAEDLAGWALDLLGPGLRALAT